MKDPKTYGIEEYLNASKNQKTQYLPYCLERKPSPCRPPFFAPEDADGVRRRDLRDRRLQRLRHAILATLSGTHLPRKGLQVEQQRQPVL